MFARDVLRVLLPQFPGRRLSMALSTAQLRLGRLSLILLAVIVVLLDLFDIIRVWPRSQQYRNALHPQQAWDDIDIIRNETLGFQKIFAINLPGRPDKRDNIILGSSVCDFRVDWIDGVTPEEISPKTYPYNWNYDHTTSEYASRRAHLNAIQRIVEERLESAIIMEDDADWDVSIKTQLQDFALAVRALQGTTDTPTASPYGEDWDVLWMGHCGLECKTDLPFYQTPDDPTIPPPRHFLPYWRDVPPIERPDHSRLTCTVNDGVCSSFYAVTYHGAQRILAALSVNPSGLAEEIDTGAQIDVVLGRMCGHGYLRCFAPFPALTGSYRSGGPAAKVSDIHDQGGDPVGFASWGVLYSTLLNINNILKGAPIHATWDDVGRPDILPEEVTIQEGSIYMMGEKGIEPVAAVPVRQPKQGSMNVS